MTLQEWKNSVLKNYLEKQALSEKDLSHLEDWIKRAHPKLSARLSVPEAIKKSQEWTIKLNEASQNLKKSGKVEEIISFPDGLRWVRLCGEVSKKWEGLHMGHCVASYERHKNIYSLRDKDQLPRLTLEISYKEIMQIQGKGNTYPSVKYLPHIREFIKVKNPNCPDKALIDMLGLYYLSENERQRIDREYDNLKYLELSDKYKQPVFTEQTKLKGEMSHSLEVLRQIMECKRFDLAAQMLQIKGRSYVSGGVHHFDYAMEKIVLSGQVNLVELALARLDFKYHLNNPLRLIHHAVRSKSLPMIEYFLEKLCPEVEAAGRALALASQDGNLTMCKLIVEKYITNPREAVKRDVIGSSANYPEVFNYFYELGYREEDWRYTLLTSVSAKDLSVAKKVLSLHSVPFSILSNIFSSSLVNENLLLCDLLIAHDQESFKNSNLLDRLKGAMGSMARDEAEKYLDDKLSALNP